MLESIHGVWGLGFGVWAGGFTALWERIVQDLGNLKDMVLETIKSFLLERIDLMTVVATVYFRPWREFPAWPGSGA